MTKSDRRRDKRFPIRVLVNCLPPGAPRKRNGHATQGWEMWARDLGDNGVRLQWSLAWATRDYVPNFRIMDERPVPHRVAEAKSPAALLKKGSTILLDGLVYDDQGAKPMKGKVQWVKPGKKGTCEFGVLITTPNRKSYFRALAA